MAPITPAQANAIVKRGADILEDAAELTSGVDPNYIRDAQPESIFEALPLAAARQGCRRYAEKGGDYPPLRAARAERACRPYLDSLDYGEGPQIKLPFTGGQCAGVSYQIDWSWSTGSFNSGPQQAVRQGPLSFSREGTGSLDCGSSGATYNVYTVIDGTGASPISLAAGCGASLDSLTVTRLGGGADDCGNTTPEYTAPGLPPAPDPPGPIRFNPRPDIDVDIDVTVNIDGSLNVDIGTGPITIDPFGGDDDDGGGEPGGGNGGREPGDQGEGGEPEDVDDTEPAQRCFPNRKLVGVLVQVIETPPRANQLFNKTEVYTKGAYFVYFGGGAGYALNPEGAITRADQFYYAPDGANCYRVVPNVGFVVRVTPYLEREE